MIEQLRKHLTFLFTCATGAVLSLILAITFLFQRNFDNARMEAVFQSRLLDLTNKLETESSISDRWLSNLEAEGRIIVHIEENVKPLFFPGAWEPDTDREILIQTAKMEAQKRGADTSSPMLTTSISKSGVFSVRGNHGDTYQAYVLVLSNPDSFRSLVLLWDTTKIVKGRIWKGLFFLLLAFFGILVLYTVSRILIGRTLSPVAEAKKRQAEFVAAASHELRSPLAVIQASASAIESLPSQAPQMAAAIQEECSRAGSLVKNLLLIATSDSGAIKTDCRPLEPDMVMLRLYENYEPLCQSKGVSLKLRMPEHFLPTVSLDESCLYQILSIFLDNAVAYGCPRDKIPVIILDGDSNGSEIFLSVIDNGPGITVEERSNIFGRFYRGDPSRSSKEHFGLGLSIARELAGQLGIRIEVGDAPESGTIFRLCIPI